MELPQQPYEYGIIDGSNQHVDIPIKNTSDKKVFIFRSDVDKRFQIHYSNKTIMPDSIVFIRIKFLPTKKGLFEENIKIHFSCFNEPKTLKITGYTSEIPKLKTVSCPSFSQENVASSLSLDMKVKVIDKKTKKPIHKANVKMIKNGVINHTFSTNKQGLDNRNINLGLYYFVANKEGYNTEEYPKYINKNNNYVLFELEKNDNAEEDLSTEVNLEENKEKEDINTQTDIEEDTEEDNNIKLPLNLYKPNNIVFLIDVSSSMKYTGKLDLLKKSMIEMTSILRDIDNITIVTYASNSLVAMETTSANNKDSIINTIVSLKAKGLTAGGKGMKLAYSKACESFIPEGNNEIIMATDGDFNSGSENIYKLAKRYKSKGVKVSVIGIKNKNSHRVNMKKLSDNGGGNYIRIDNYEDARNNLIEDIKQNSKIK